MWEGPRALFAYVLMRLAMEFTKVSSEGGWNYVNKAFESGFEETHRALSVLHLNSQVWANWLIVAE